MSWDGVLIVHDNVYWLKEVYFSDIITQVSNVQKIKSDHGSFKCGILLLHGVDLCNKCLCLKLLWSDVRAKSIHLLVYELFLRFREHLKWIPCVKH